MVRHWSRGFRSKGIRVLFVKSALVRVGREQVINESLGGLYGGCKGGGEVGE